MTDRVFCLRAGLYLFSLIFLPLRFAVAADLNVPGDYATIQAAIDAAADGDSVMVAAGSYAENLNLKSGVYVRGVEAARTFLEPETPADPVILADSIDDVLLANFTIINAQVGFDVINATNLRIANNVFVSTSQFGLRVDDISQVEVLNSVFWDNDAAIRRGTEDVQITNCGFVGNMVTITSLFAQNIDPNINVDNSGFFDNADVDTGLGVDFIVGDPLFSATDDLDFHVQENSPYIDTGLGTDVIDNTTADIGVYGGEFADVRPFPVAAPGVVDASGASPPPYRISLDWPANLSYLVTNNTMPGSYRVYYRQNQSGPPYDGTDAGNGTQPSPVDVCNGTTLTLEDLQPSIADPASPQLLSADPRSAAAVVSWSPVSGIRNYRVYYGTAVVSENQIDVGDVTSYTVTGLQNGTEYRFAVSASAQPVYHFSITVRDSTLDCPPGGNESDYSSESTLAIGALIEGLLSNELTATPDVTVPYPDLPDSGCFVATAAFGVDWSAEVQVLRDFRDRLLLSSRPGRAFVRWYYRNGPSAAALITEFDSVRPVVRGLLWPLVVIALFALAAPPVAVLVVLLLCFSLPVVRRMSSCRATLTRSAE